MANKYDDSSVSSCRKRLGSIVKTIREEQGLTRQEFAAAAGMKPSLLTTVEYGAKILPESMVPGLFAALGIAEEKRPGFESLCLRARQTAEPSPGRTRRSKYRLWADDPLRQIKYLLAKTWTMQNKKELEPEEWIALRVSIVNAFHLRSKYQQKKMKQLAVEYGQDKTIEKPPPDAMAIVADL